MNRVIQVVQDFSACVALKFDGWHQKTIRHLFCNTSSFAHNFTSIGEFKLELQSGNFNLGQIGRFFVPCDFEIWWMTLENNRAPFLYYAKHCASFQSHRWIQTWVTVRKRSIRVKSAIFGPVWPRNLTDDLEKQQGTSSMLLQALRIIS